MATPAVNNAHDGVHRLFTSGQRTSAAEPPAAKPAKPPRSSTFLISRAGRPLRNSSPHATPNNIVEMVGKKSSVVSPYLSYSNATARGSSFSNQTSKAKPKLAFLF